MLSGKYSRGQHVSSRSEFQVSEGLGFHQLGLSQGMQKVLEDVEYFQPTPVQETTVPLVVSGIDLIVQSQTGTGKTAAFAIPLSEKLDAKAQVQALVLTPTRELAKQVAEEFDRLGAFRGIKSAAVYGGAGFGPQITALKKAQVVVATPGRLLDHVRRGNLDLSQVGIFVLDEADEMLSMGFEQEVSSIIDLLPEEKQSLLFSATVTEDIKRLGSRFLQHPEYLSFSADSVAARSVEHFYFVVNGNSLLRDLSYLIEFYQPPSALIFCNTRDDTVLVQSYLQKRGYSAEMINGDLPQGERERALLAVAEGETRFLVATDVAARGIDISGLPYVINYMMPENPESYIHRTGRTGRAGQHGVALSLMTPLQIGTFYQLKTIYHLDMVEQQVPSREEILAVRKKQAIDRLVAELDAEWDGLRFAPYLPLAERIVKRADAEETVARLLALWKENPRRLDELDGEVEAAPQKPAPSHEVKATHMAPAKAHQKPEAKAPRAPKETKAAKEKVVEAKDKAPRSEKEAPPLAPAQAAKPQLKEEAEAPSYEPGTPRRGKRGQRRAALKAQKTQGKAVQEAPVSKPAQAKSQPVKPKPAKPSQSAKGRDNKPTPKSPEDPSSPSEKPAKKQKGRAEFSEVEINIGLPKFNEGRVKELVCYLAGLFPEDLGPAESSFHKCRLHVRTAYCEDLIEAIDGQEYAGLTLNAKVVG